jgi:uncharacterized protein with HEPN domain
VKRDSVYLAHILQEMEFIETNFSGRPVEEIVGDEMMQRSVIRSLEIIGEASKNLSPGVREQYPGIPWSGMARMRDRLIHGYFSVRWELVQDVVQNEVPMIKPEIRAIYSALLSEEAGEGNR